MSALSPASLTASLGSSLPATGLPPINQALEPAAIRNGDQTAKKAYQEGLAFEDVLVNELAQEMTATVPGLGGSGDGSGDSTDGSDGSDGSSGSSSALGPYASMLPQALTSAVMSGGGTGLAYQIARDLDPALNSPSTSKSTTSSASTSATPSTGASA